MPIWSYPWQNVTDPLAIPPGALRHEVQIQSPGSTQDAAGQESTTNWSDAMPPALAAFETTSMRQPFQDGFVSVVAYRITIRFPGHSFTITDGMRVLRGNSVYLIQAVENVQQRNRVIHMTCIRIDDAKVGS